MRVARINGAVTKLLILLCVFPVANAVVDPLTWGLAVGGAVGIYAGYQALQCNYVECCTPKWITPDLNGRMMANITNYLHGQHLVKDVVIKSIKAHVRKFDPQKPLVLSFHGWTGGGKTFVSKIIAHHLYHNGFDSEFVHLFIATHHFPHADSINLYKDNLVNWIKGNISQCQQSLFIFDEVDKMPRGLFDAIKPYLDYHQHVDGARNLHFLSNAGGSGITQIALQNWKAGRKREELKLKDFNSALTLDAFNEKGGLKHSSLIDSNLIDHFIPFLPLERQHVKLCVIDELKRQNRHASGKVIDHITDEVVYLPLDLGVFSKTGCKEIEKLVDYVLETLPENRFACIII
uniref:Torsin-1A C-terminal domain-containing protein n=1 Tax=Strigamia maritima TaxID=126957 RepID=T1JNP5_STRMM